MKNLIKLFYLRVKLFFVNRQRSEYVRRLDVALLSGDANNDYHLLSWQLRKLQRARHDLKLQIRELEVLK